MKFDKGICGVVIVVIALFGTIFTGYFLNVDHETVTVTEYDRVTDVSSLFTYTQQPDYIDYNPAKNYTGYQLSDGSSNGVSFTQASGINQYPMSTTSSTTITVDLSVLNSTQQFVPPNTSNGWVANYDGIPFVSLDVYPDGQRGLAWYNPYQVNAENLLTYLTSNNLIPANTTAITIHPKNSNSMVGFSLNPNLDNTSYRSFARLDSTYYDDPIAYGQTLQYERNVNFNYSSNASQGLGSPQYEVTATPQQCYLTYDVDSELWTLDVNGDSMTMEYGILTWPSSNKAVSTYSYRHGTSIVWDGFADAFTLNPYDTLVDIVFSYAPVYNYLKPSDGVAISNTSNVLTTNWSNGKSIGDLAIAFHNVPASNWNGFVTNAGTYIGVANDGSHSYIGVNQSGTQLVTNMDFGAWDSFELHVSPMEGKVYILPIMQFNSFVDYSTANYRIEVCDIPSTPITNLKWDATSNSFKFSVSNTIVQMSTKLLMVDPILNITDYFTLAEGYRLDINSFAKYGTSMTVNGVTLYGDSNGNPISDTNNVYYDGKTFKLTNIQIAKDTLTGHTYINFVNDRKSIDLGVSTSDVVSMGGTWYFNTVLDEGRIAESETYTWDWANSLTGTQSIVIFMGLIVVSSLLANKFWSIKILDLAVIVCSIVILWTVAELI